MGRAVRALGVAAGGFYAAFAVGLLLDAAWAKALWVWPAAPRMNHVFVASIALAIAAEVLWFSYLGSRSEMRGGSLNLLLVGAGGAWTLFRHPDFAANPRIRTFAFVFAGLAAASAAAYVYARGAPMPAGPRAPRWLRVAFVVVIAVLVPAGIALVAGAAHVFPWPLTPAASALYGWIFLGAATYFAHVALHPTVDAARGELLGLLAYDAVLVVPWLAHFARVLPEHRPSLVVYSAVVVGTLLLSLYALFVDPTTRLLPAARARSSASARSDAASGAAEGAP